MKLLGMLAVVTGLISGNVLAGEHTINTDARMGWNYKDNDVKKTGTQNSSSFNVDYLRTTFAGAVTPSVKYNLILELLGDTSTTDAVDGTSSLIEEAFITKTFSTATSVTIGKKPVFVGGREYDHMEYDVYTYSAFYNATPENQVGVTVAQELMGQTFSLQYFNGNKTNGTNPAVNAQSKYGYAVGWNGDLLNGMIMPIVGYTVVPEAAGAGTTVANGTRANKGDDTYLAAGLLFNLSKDLVVEADYGLATEKDAGTNQADLKTTSIVGLVRYSTETISPFVKIISDTNKTDSTKTGSRLAYDLGVEFKEAQDDMIRYHVVYTGSTVKTNSNTTELKSSPKSILVGLKFNAAILK